MRMNARCEGMRFTVFVVIGAGATDLNKFIVIVLFSRLLTLRLHRSERGEENPERGASLALPRIQIILTAPSLEKIPAVCQYQNYRLRGLLSAVTRATYRLENTAGC